MKTLLKSVYLTLRGVILNSLGVLLPRGAAPSSIAAPKKILFIRIDRIGDLVLSTPALRAIKKRYPGAELTVLAGPAAAPLLASDPGVNRVIVWDASKGLREEIKVISLLKGFHFDLAIDPYAEYEAKTALIAFLSGAGTRVGYQSYGRGIFFNVEVSPMAERAHFIDETLEVLKVLGINEPRRDPELFVSEEAAAEARAFLKNSGAEKNGFLVAVHPGGYYESQRWPPESFAAVIGALIEKYGAKVLLIGGLAERELVENIAAGVAGGPGDKNIIKAVNLKTDLLCALMRESRLFIGNNSGPLHIASALKIPSISTMGPTDPVRWYPFGPAQVVLRSELPCSPCNKGLCKTHECMKNITPEMMLENVKRLTGTLGLNGK